MTVHIAGCQSPGRQWSWEHTHHTEIRYSVACCLYTSSDSLSYHPDPESISDNNSPATGQVSLQPQCLALSRGSSYCPTCFSALPLRYHSTPFFTSEKRMSSGTQCTLESSNLVPHRSAGTGCGLFLRTPLGVAGDNSRLRCQRAETLMAAESPTLSHGLSDTGF